MERAREMSLEEASALFLGQLPLEEKQAKAQEINKFVQWYGRERAVGGITGHEVEEFAEGEATSTDYIQKLEPVRAFLAYLKKQGLTQTNLSTHLRVKKLTLPKGVRTKGSPSKAVELTREGHARMKEELHTLQMERIEIAEELRRAAADKDFRENAPLEAAREHQGHLEGRIRELEATLKGVVVLGEEEGDRVKAGLGSALVLVDLSTGEKLEYTLVNPAEANPLTGKVSVASPVGRAILDRSQGDEVEVAVPAGTLRYRIEKVKR